MSTKSTSSVISAVFRTRTVAAVRPTGLGIHLKVHTAGKAYNSSLSTSTSSSTPSIEQNLLNSSPANHNFHSSKSTTKPHGHKKPLVHYHNLVASGTLRGDEHQTRIIQKLQDLHDELMDYTPPSIPETDPSNSLLSRIFSRSEPIPTQPPDDAPKGLYLYGDVGTGKTMLMDLFYSSLPPYIQRKRRVHFHAFMIDVHKRLHAAKIAMGYKGGDPIPPVARDLAREAYVLCFDEFQVTDIADAMILRRLLESLLNFGVVAVITSNRHPDDLYKNGIQRSSFIPAIELLKNRLDVTDLDSGTDYRRVPRALSKVYYDPLTPSNALEIEKIFKSMTHHDDKDSPVKNRQLTIWGRKLTIPESTSKVAKFKFDDLCGKPLSAADYLEITKTFGTLFVLDVPKMGMDSKDKARRFITFIDACYESKTKLFVTSEVPVFQVFSDEDLDSGKPISDHMRGIMDDLGISQDIVGKSSIFSGEEELFAFARACSRLVQMGSKQWVDTAGQH
ncbi:AFG1-like ATPase-domain-containing protein [Lentinula boryana]|uniref:AFG1-like ATPase-domain-containing protein n=1 Tax=Lentinula boryana TaxID=40481 RepID=A0ABQ8QAH8_9AGAR|nr:AFG1-like ATPase-domain-containing protein [Lentinula boryana]